jgi:hypothetical protein
MVCLARKYQVVITGEKVKFDVLLERKAVET